MISSFFAIFIFGLSIGCLLNRLVRNLPEGKWLAPYTCRLCHARFPWTGTLPLGTLLQSGRRCRCGTASLRPLVVELLTGAMFVWCLALFGFTLAFFKAILLLAFLVIITFIDLELQLILDRVVVGLACCGAVVNFVFPDLTGSVSFLGMLGGALVGGGVMLLIAVLSRGGMGGGDIKFMAALGLWFGPKLTLLILLLGFFIGGIGSAAVLLLGLKGRKDFIPFGPFIAAGAFLGLLYGQSILHWYVSKLGNP